MMDGWNTVMKPKVSIITPCFNSERTIRDTIESVLSQTYQNIEYVIVDGGSTDDTVNIIREYYPVFNGRMKFVSEKDKGVYDAMNKGIKMSTGALIGIINSDDYYEPDAVETINGYMSEDKYQVIYGYCKVWNKGHLTKVLKNRHENLNNRMIPHPTCFVTRDIYRDFGLFLTAFRIANDYELMIRLYKSNKVKFTQVDKVIANFREGGLSRDTKRVAREGAFISYYHSMISFKDMISRLAENL